MRIKRFKGVLSTMIIASLMVLALSISFTGPASAQAYSTVVRSGSCVAHVWTGLLPTLLEDNFDSYPTGSFPDGWTPLFNAVSDPSNNIVTSATYFSHPNSLQLYGAHSGCWAAESVHSLSSKPSIIFLEARVKASGDIFTSTSCHYWDIAVGFCESYHSSGAYWKGVLFTKDGKIHGSDVGDLQPYEVNTWYKVKMKLDYTGSSPVVTYWVDDVQRGTGDWTISYNYVFVSSGGGKGWIDDVKVWTPTPPPPPPAPVGGTVTPVDKLALLVPWIILAALITIAAVSVAVYWRRR